jgi:metallo-beta-lactamase family protein
MEIEFVGAAGSVTGSKHLVHTRHATVLLDCGLVQGKRKDSIAANKDLGFAPRRVDAVVLSHAHIDHSGALPLMVKSGFDGPIYTTPATRDLCAAMLEDSALIQAQDARYINRTIEKDHVEMDPVEPLYTPDDVVRVLEQMISVPYRRKVPVAPGVEVSFFDAGHVLGSAITLLEVEEDGAKKRVVFTGDLGRKNMPILRDPEVPTGGCDLLLTESTYGDRLHKSIEAIEEDLLALVVRTHKRGGKLIIPSFALERAQEVVFYLKSLAKRGVLPKIPVYVDSPLTVKITEIFKLHPECYDKETRALIEGHDSPFDFDNLRYVSDREDSKAIDTSQGSAIIISASGMCEAGRVLHHLKANIESEKSAIAIVGFQAQHTLGRRLVEKRPRVKIFGVERDVRAEVVTLNGLSAHADQKDLVGFAKEMRATGGVKKIALVHGEERAQHGLVEALAKAGMAGAVAPRAGMRITV